MTNSLHITTQDLAPLYRNSIGVDRLFENLFARHNASGNNGNYPPYNIIALTDDQYVIEIAVAGFKQDEISITAQNGQLTVTGEKAHSVEIEEPERKFLHQGIGVRKFARNFELADYVEVGSAELTDGILVINLERIVPDSMKPREIQIGQTAIEE